MNLFLASIQNTEIDQRCDAKIPGASVTLAVYRANKIISYYQSP